MSNPPLPFYTGLSKSKYPPRTIARRLISLHLEELGIHTYTPQLVTESSALIAGDYSQGRYILPWKSETYEWLRKRHKPLLFHASGYWFGRNSGGNPKAFSWQGRDGKRYDLVNPIREEMTAMFAGVLVHLNEHGIRDPWIMVDEPPHSERYGWTPEIELRYVVFVRSAVDAGWTVGVCVPGPKQLAFWFPKLPAQRWLLNGKHPVTEFQAELEELRQQNKEVWLYNIPVGANIEQTLRDYQPQGYLNWTLDEAPHAIATSSDNRSVRLTLHGEELLRNCRQHFTRSSAPTEPPPRDMVSALRELQEALQRALALITRHLETLA